MVCSILSEHKQRRKHQRQKNIIHGLIYCITIVKKQRTVLFIHKNISKSQQICYVSPQEKNILILDRKIDHSPKQKISF